MELKIHSTTHFKALTPAIVKAILAPVILFVVVYLRERPLAISPVYLSVATLALVSIRFFIDLKKVRYRPVQIQLKDHMFSMEYYDKDVVNHIESPIEDLEVTSGGGLKQKWIKFSTADQDIKVYTQLKNGLNYNQYVHILESIDQEQS